MKKEVIKTIIFWLIFLILFYFASKVFLPKGIDLKGRPAFYGSDTSSFYKLEKNSLDIIFFGSSYSYASFSPDIIEEETGLKSYNFATQQQPIYITYHYMVEALKTQKPKYIVMETYMTTYTFDYCKGKTERAVRDSLDRMKMSKNKIEAINVSVEKPEDRWSYYFNIIKYHTRYEEITGEEIIKTIQNETLDNKGYSALKANEDLFIDNTDVLKIEDETQLTYKNETYLHKIISLAKENNIRLILVETPQLLTPDRQRNYNEVRRIAAKRGIEYIDYNTKFDELDLNGPGNFYDVGHLSGPASARLSRHFANHINEIEGKK